MNTAIATAKQEQRSVSSEVRHVISIRDVAESASRPAVENENMSQELSAQPSLLSEKIKRFII